MLNVISVQRNLYVFDFWCGVRVVWNGFVPIFMEKGVVKGGGSIERVNVDVEVCF